MGIHLAEVTILAGKNYEGRDGVETNDGNYNKILV